MSETASQEEDFTCSVFFAKEPFSLAGQELSAARIWKLLGTRLTESRQQKIKQVCQARCQSLVPVLEGIYDRGNVSAVMRSAEAFGFYRFHIVETPEARFKAANRVTQGADKWLWVEKFHRPSQSIEQLKAQGYKVYATHLESAVPIQEIDFTQKVAVVFGNEKEGVSSEVLKQADGSFVLPMYGFSQSFNISVAAALTFSSAYWKRVQRLGRCADLSEQEQKVLMANYALRSFDSPGPLLQKLLKC